MIRTICLLSICLAVGLCFAGTTTTSTKVKNLTAFTKLWGYVKHFYPSDEAQAIDWDKFAVYGTQYVINIRTNDELQKALYDLFQPIVPDLKLYTKAKPKTKISDIIPGRATAFWQYEGYNNTNSTSSFRSIRTNRPTKIMKNPNNRFIWASIAPQIAMDIPHNAKLRVSFVIRKDGSDSLETEIRLGYNGDHAKDYIGHGDNAEKCFIMEGKEDTQEPLWIAFLNLHYLLLDSIKVELWKNEAWQTVFVSDFANDTLGALPEKFNINMSPLSPVMCSDVDVLVDRVSGKHCLSIRKSVSELDYTLGIINRIFPEELQYGEMLDKPLVKGLNCSFPMVLQCDMKNTYPIANRDKLQQLIQKYSSVDLSDRADPGVWFAGVIRYWNELQFFYPYFEYNICNWDNELSLCLERVIKCSSFLEYKQALLLLISKTKDGHAFLSDQSHNAKMPKFNTCPVDGKWIVSSVLDDSIGVRLADEVVKMNGKDFKDLMNENRPYFLSANPETTDIRLFSRFLKTYQDSVASFTFRDSKNAEYSRELTLEDYSGWKWVVGEDRIVYHDGGIVYLNANIITDTELQEALPKLVEAKGIILDLRYYPSISYNFISHLLTEPDSLSITLTKRYLRPQEELPRPTQKMPTWGLLPIEPRITAKVIALCSRNCQSYCEAYLHNLQHNRLASVVGQPTVGANGDVIVTPLPGNIKVYWTGLLVRNPDESRFFGVGIVPDVIVNKSLQDIRDGIDTERKVALKLLRESLKYER